MSLIAIRLIDKTLIIAKKFRKTASSIWINDIKYIGPNQQQPIFLEDSMLLDMDAVESFAIIQKDDDEISEN